MFKQTIKHTSIWIDQIPDKKQFPQLTDNTDTDVAVIGAGITGVLTAWRLAQKGIKVILIDKNHVAGGDTSATTGFLLRIPDTSISNLISAKGDKFVSDFFAATSDAQQDIINIVKSLNINCDLEFCDSYYGSYRNNDAALALEIASIKKGDSTAILENANFPIEHPFSESIKFKNEAKWNPRKFIFELLKHETSKSIQIFEETEATELNFDGQNATITTPLGTITAKKIILTIGNPSELLPELSDLVKTKITYAVTAYSEKKLSLPNLYWDTEEPYFYYRTIDEHTLVVGGADVDIKNINQDRSFEVIKKFISKHFGDKLTITNKWSGSIYHTKDGLPYVFPHPHTGGKLFVATGYGGNGMVGGILASQVLSELAFGEMHDASSLLSYRRTDVIIPPLTPRKNQQNETKTFVHFGTTNDFVDKKMICKTLNNKKVIVFAIKNHYYAISNTCSHAGGSLCDGRLNETEIECPLHGAKFDVTTGEAKSAPATRPVEKFPTRINGENIEVEIPTSQTAEDKPNETKRTYWNQLFIFTGFATLFWLLEFTWQYWFQAKGDLDNSFIRSFAFAGTTLISLALLSSAIFKWWPKTSDYWRFRRYAGVGGFVLIFFHVLKVFITFKFDFASIFFSLNPLQNPIIFGSIGFYIFLPMALTSTDWAVDKLTPKWWKRLHRLVYIAYISSIFHFISTNPPEINTVPGYILIIVTSLALFGQIFWFTKISAKEKFRSIGAFVGISIIIASIIIGYLVYKTYFVVA